MADDDAREKISTRIAAPTMRALEVAAAQRRATLAQISRALIEEANKRGRTKTALLVMEGQCKARAELASECNDAAATLCRPQDASRKGDRRRASG